MEPYLCKCGALCAPSNDAISGCCNSWVELVAPNASAGHVHLQSQFEHQWWIPQPFGLSNECWDGDV
eukprot:8635441-Karenia_brevis.AAC.1